MPIRMDVFPAPGSPWKKRIGLTGMMVEKKIAYSHARITVLTAAALAPPCGGMFAFMILVSNNSRLIGGLCSRGIYLKGGAHGTSLKYTLNRKSVVQGTRRDDE